MNPSTPRASLRKHPAAAEASAVMAADTSVSSVSSAARHHQNSSAGLFEKVNLHGVRWLVLSMMGAIALVIPMVAHAGHTPRLLASDSFTRTSSQGWTSANVGGVYSNPQGASGLSVNGSSGSIVLLQPGSVRSADLDSVSVLNANVTFRTSIDTAPTGGGTSVAAVLRHNGDRSYRATVRFAPDGVYASVWQIRPGRAVRIGSEQRLAGVSAAPKHAIWVRVRIVGASPTRVQIKSWADGQPTPAAWGLTVLDTAGDIQTAGSIGIFASLGLNATTAPVRVNIDDLRAKRLATSAPTPTNTPTTTPKPTPAPTGTPAPTATPTPTSAGMFASDTFSRNVTGGWGSADKGSAYSLFSYASDYSVSGGVGRVLVRAGQTRSATLLSASVGDADLSFRFSADRLPTSGNGYVYGVARHNAAGGEYRVKVRLDAFGGVFVQATRMAGGTETGLGSETRINGLTFAPGVFVWVRSQVTGTNPTSLRMRIWEDGTTEPTTWQYQSTDSSTALQANGSVGVMAHLSPTTTSGTVALAFDNFLTMAPTNAPLPPTGPTATPTPDPTPTTTPSPTATPAPTPTATPAPTPTATPAPTPTPTSVPNGSYYVGTGGDDSNPGTSGAPWLTLQKAANSAPSGATIVVRAGRYAGFTYRNGGTSSNPTVFMADPNGTAPVLDGGIGNRLDVVYFSATAHDVQISGFVITNAQGGDYAGSGIRTEAGSTRITISDNTIRDNHSYGVNSYYSSYVTISNNDISGNEEGIQIAHGGEGTRILDNQVHDNNQMLVNTPTSVDAHDDSGATGIGFLKTTGHVLASGNSVWGNRAPSYDYVWDGSAFDFYGASNVTVTDNVIWDNENVFETGTDSGVACDNNVFARNVASGAPTQGRAWGIFIRCGNDMVVANNTFTNIQGFVFSIGMDSARFNGTVDGLRVVNNVISVAQTGALVFGLTTALPASVQIDYNLVNTTGQVAQVPGHGSTNSMATFNAWTGYQAHSVSGDPLFVNAAAGDYHLKAASPAIDAGISIAGISASFTGSAPDLGRFERP